MLLILNQFGRHGWGKRVGNGFYSKTPPVGWQRTRQLSKIHQTRTSLKQRCLKLKLRCNFFFSLSQLVDVSDFKLCIYIYGRNYWDFFFFLVDKLRGFTFFLPVIHRLNQPLQSDCLDFVLCILFSFFLLLTGAFSPRNQLIFFFYSICDITVGLFHFCFALFLFHVPRPTHIVGAFQTCTTQVRTAIRWCGAVC